LLKRAIIHIEKKDVYGGFYLEGRVVGKDPNFGVKIPLGV